MTPFAAFLLGIRCGAVPSRACWARSADAAAIEAAKAEDAAYSKGYNRALAGKPQENRKIIIYTTL